MALQKEPEVHPVPRSKAPWALKAETYFLFMKLGSLPEGLYDSLEETWGAKENGEFKGGLGGVMIVRYQDTPVGQYDELALIPGNFSVPQPSNNDSKIKIPKKALRIARIYVSQRTTTYNGRLNWNIPKHLARFSFSAPPTSPGSTPPASMTVRVFPPNSSEGDGTPAFFACTLTPFTWLPGIPINSKYIPLSLMQAQPPCPEAAGRMTAAQFEAEGKPIDPYDISEKNEEAIAVGTERWCAFDIVAGAQKARGCWVEILKSEQTDEEGSQEVGRWWPKDVAPWRIGAWMEGAELEIGESLEWKL